MDYWNKQLFSYCERALDPTFWAEPLNAVSNAAFWLAALAALIIWFRQPRQDRHSIDVVLIVLVMMIGVGSFLFHTYATRWAVLMDVIPITIFMLVYLGVASRRFMGWHWIATGLAVVAFYVVLAQAEKIRCGDGPCLNGSVGYLPALAVLLLFGALLAVARHPAWKSLLAAGVIFAISLAFRTVDRTLCEVTDLGLVPFIEGPVGTHALWHILNAVLLFILVRASIRHGLFIRRVQEGL